MISCCPIEDTIDKPVPKVARTFPKPTVARENTECNLLLYFFIVGAIVLMFKK